MKTPIEAGKLFVAEVNDIMLPRFDAEEYMEYHVAALNHSEQELHAQSKENYSKLSMVMLQCFQHVVSCVMFVMQD